MTILFALLGGLIFALVLVPVLASFLFRHGYHEWENPLLRWFTPVYAWVIRGLLKMRWLVATVSIAALAWCLPCWCPRLGTEFLPYLDEGVIWVRANFPEGTSLEQTSEYGRRLREIALELPDVKFAMVQAGRNDDGTDPFPPSRIEMMIGPRPREQWTQFRDEAGVDRRPGEALSRAVPHDPLQLHATDHRQRHRGHQRHVGEPGGGIQRPRFRGAVGPGPANGRAVEAHPRRHRREHRAGGAATATGDPTGPSALLRATTSASRT